MNMKPVFVLLAAALLTACTVQPVREVRSDAQKAAALNAELGVRYMMQGNNELALQKLQDALKYDHRSLDAHHYIAELYRRLDENEKAERHYREAIKLVPRDESASSLHNNYGVFLCGIRRYDEAEKQFLTVLNNPVYPARAEVYENLGLCYSEQPNLEKSDLYFRQALNLEPRRPKSLMGLAQVSLERSEYVSARAFLQRYLQVAPHSPASLWLGIRTERVLGDKNAEASYGLLLIRRFPESREARHYQDSLSRE